MQMEAQRKQAPVVAIGHEWVVSGDAVGNDISGMYRVLSDLGLQVVVFGQSFDDATATQMKICRPPAPELLDADLLIYHHSTYWQAGEEFLRRFRGNVVFRYHNVTPPSFFEPYSQRIAQLCAAGIEQTRRLAQRFNKGLWLAVSEFNRDDLIAHGVAPGQISVVPPFNITADFLRHPTYVPSSPLQILFVGRFAPNKAHADLIRIIHSYITNISKDIVLNLVGPTDFENLRTYLDDLRSLIDRLRVNDNVRIIPSIPREELSQMFTESAVFLCCSRHEGFCLPVIEAQAAGLPVIAVNRGALPTTLGAGQILCEPPESVADYHFFALLINTVCFNADLRSTLVKHGYQNLISRFSTEVVENQFITALLQVVRGIR
jgi:glycosyltransferase involved in cell wall biosynthesis